MPVSWGSYSRNQHLQFSSSILVVLDMAWVDCLYRARDMALISFFCIYTFIFGSTSLHCMIWVGYSVKNRFMYVYKISELSILFHWSVCQFVCYYHAVLKNSFAVCSQTTYCGAGTLVSLVKFTLAHLGPCNVRGSLF